MRIMGIDPGLSGGIAWFDLQGKAHAVAMPVLNHRPDVAAIKAILRLEDIDRVIMESLGIRPGQSANAGATAGINWGIIAGTLAALEIPVLEVSPQRWKPVLGIANRTAKGETKPTPKQIKERSIALAVQLFPTVSLLPSERCRVRHDGMAEALLLAEYGRRIGGDPHGAYDL